MTLCIVTIAILAIVFFACWRRTRDVFHPCIVFVPQFVFLYGVLPVNGLRRDPQWFLEHAGGGFLVWYQLLALVLMLSLLLGVRIGARRPSPAAAAWRPLPVANAPQVRAAALVLAAIGAGAWLIVVYGDGGFAGAYGHGYGGGSAESGYLRELRFVGIVGVPLVFLTRTGKGMRAADWALVLLCAAPMLVHGLIGARRGPTFIAVVTLAGGYLYFLRKRIGLSLLIAGAALLGFLLLFLVANRDGIYIGSDLSGLRTPTAFFDASNADEFLIGSAVVRYTEAYGGFYGTRELAHLVSRLIPSALWPTVYEDLGAALGLAVDLSLNAGVDPVGVFAVAGWQPSVGSATGFVGALWLEFQYVSPLVAVLIGVLYGAAWRGARHRIAARLLYLLLMALSVHLVMQDLDAWLYRLLLYGGPLLVAASAVRLRRPGDAAAPSARAPSARAPVAAPPAAAPHPGGAPRLRTRMA